MQGPDMMQCRLGQQETDPSHYTDYLCDICIGLSLCQKPGSS